MILSEVEKSLTVYELAKIDKIRLFLQNSGGKFHENELFIEALEKHFDALEKPSDLEKYRQDSWFQTETDVHHIPNVRMWIVVNLAYLFKNKTWIPYIPFEQLEEHCLKHYETVIEKLIYIHSAIMDEKINELTNIVVAQHIADILKFELYAKKQYYSSIDLYNQLITHISSQ